MKKSHSCIIIVKISLLIVTFVINCLMLCSCSSSGIDQRAIIDGVIITKGLNKTMYNFSLLETGNSEINGVVSVESDNIVTAIEQIESVTGKEPFFGQNAYVILSTRFTENKVSKELDYFVNSRQIYPNTVILFSGTKTINMLCKEIKASDYIVSLAETESKKNKNLSMTLLQIVNSLKNKENDHSVCVLGFSNNVILAKSAQLNQLM